MQHFPSFHRNSSTTGIRSAREQLCDILNRHYSATAAAAQEEKKEEKQKKKRQQESAEAEAEATSSNSRKGKNEKGDAVQ